MTDISILTLHFYDNYGSVLQAWALRHYLNCMADCRAEIIPFRPQIPDYCYFSEPTLQRRFREKQEMFRDFRRDFLGMNIPDGGDEVLEDIRCGICITGSDIVWSSEHAALHPAYFLDFVRDGTKRVAYAASQRLKNGEKSMLARYLPAFDALSVRESADRELLARYTQVPVETVLDPTLLLSAEDYEPLLRVPEDLPAEPYLLFYSLTHDPAAMDTANLLAERFGLRIVHYLADYPANVFPSDAQCFAFCGPREFLAYVKHASLVFTNSYHGTIFSILYQRPFYVQVTRGGMSVRAIELTAALGLESRRYGGWRDLTRTALEQDWTESCEKLGELRQKSRDFLRRAMHVQRHL